MGNLTDFDLMENRQNLFNAVVAMAVDDMVIYLIQSEMYPPQDNGMPPESLFKEMERRVYKKVSRMKFPVHIKRGNKTYEDPAVYALRIIDQNKSELTRRWHSIIREGHDCEEFFNDPQRLSIFTSFSTDDMKLIIEKKKKIVMEQIKNGEVPQTPPFKITSRHTNERLS